MLKLNPPYPVRIGFVGRKGHGKNTLATLMQKGVNSRVRPVEELAFADTLKAMLKVLGVTEAQLYGTTEQKEAIDPRYGVSPRRMMQTLGNEWGRQRIHEDIWVRALIGQYHGLQENEPRRAAYGHSPISIFVTDVRMPNEAKALRNEGFFLVRIRRPDLMPPQPFTHGEGDEQAPERSEHDSERYIDHLMVDMEVENAGTLEDLQAQVPGIWERAMEHRAQWGAWQAALCPARLHDLRCQDPTPGPTHWCRECAKGPLPHDGGA